MVSFWSIGSFIVPNKLQSRAAIVLDEFQRRIVVCHLYQRLLCEQRSSCTAMEDKKNKFEIGKGVDGEGEKKTAVMRTTISFLYKAPPRTCKLVSKCEHPSNPWIMQCKK